METRIMSLVRILLNNGNTHNEPSKDYGDNGNTYNVPREDFSEQRKYP